MASSTPIPCGPCQEGKVNTEAEYRCNNCEEGLCTVCSGHHKRSKSSRYHKTPDLKSFKPSIEAINTECPSHLMPCCDECIATSHSKCTEIKSVALNRETSVKRKAQVESRERSNINNMTATIETKIFINCHIKRFISDMIGLIDGRLKVVERFGKVNLLTSDGKLQKQLPISDGAWSVTQINQNTIAITYPWQKVIKIFNMENGTVTKVIKLDKECRGLSFSNNYLAVGVDSDNDDKEICIIDLEAS